MGDLLSVVSLVAFVVMMVLGLRLLRASVSPTRRSRRWLAGAAGVWIGAFLLSVVTPDPPSDGTVSRFDGVPQMSVAGYTQTWTKAYTATTCSEFDAQMTPSQQLAAAADMLALVWRKIESSTDVPGNSIITQYRDEVESHCDSPTETIAEVAWAIWINDPRFAA